MFQWNYVSNISAAAGAEIDLADHGSFGPNVFQTSSAFAGVTNDRWCPQAIQMGQSYNAIFLNQIKTRSSQAASGNYGGIMMFNVRKASNVNPLPVFQKIAEGAFGATVIPVRSILRIGHSTLRDTRLLMQIFSSTHSM